MRDGTVLLADIYRPDVTEPVPVIVSRTPYDRTLPLVPPAAVDPEVAVGAGFALVCQDTRGRHGSEGTFYPFFNEGIDGYDTVEWAAAQPWSSGAIGMAGRSYAAATQWLAAAEQPPHLRAIAPVVTGSNYYDGWIYQGGAFQLGFNLFWVHMMSKSRARLDDQYRHLPLNEAPLLREGEAGPFYLDWLAHPTDDEYWRALAPNRRYPQIHVPAYNVGGWFDIFLAGTLENFVRMRSEGGSDCARAGQRLVIGPWSHGSTYGPYPDHSFEHFAPDDHVDLAEAQLHFFDLHLKERPGGLDRESPVRIFVMGENRWREEDEWPLGRARPVRWFFHSEGDAAARAGSLSLEEPTDEPQDKFVYDPRDPAPTVGGPTSLPARLLRSNSGPLDQSKLEERPDVLTYTSAPLHRAVEVTGPLAVRLYAATTATDTDFVAKLIDVWPDGVARILAEGILRTRFRDGFQQPRLVEPGEVYAYTIDLVATSNVFLPGHRIRVTVTSSSFPRFDRNPNSGKPSGIDGPEDLRSACQTIFHDRARPSHILLPLVPR